MISVIVPVYNTYEYLPRCLESLKNQTYREIEIILVDDGSTDKSPILCDELAAGDERIRVIHKNNGGLVSAWKEGALNSRGDYLCFVDSDDWVDLDMLYMLQAETTNNPKEIISSDYVIERSDSSEYVYQALKPGVYDKEALWQEVFPIILGREYRPVTLSRCMKLISRGLILDNMHYSNPKVRMAEDVTIMIPALLDCERLVIMDHKAFYHYLYITESMVHKYDKGMYQNMLLVYEIVTKVLSDKLSKKDESYYLRMKQALDSEMLLWLLLCVKNEARGNKGAANQNIRTISKEQRKLIENAKVELREKSNVLLYACLKHPNTFMLFLLKLAIKIYYR